MIFKIKLAAKAENTIDQKDELKKALGELFTSSLLTMQDT